MSTVRREPPKDPEVEAWYEQGIADLADGKHCVGCECYRELGETHDVPGVGPQFGHIGVNACLTIARALRDFESYEVEESKP